jgi:predicted CoA-substrate-specific enzyme activase
MADTHTVIGIDIGSISISIAELDCAGTARNTAYGFHRGRIGETLAELLSGFDLLRCCGVALTSSSPRLVKGAACYDGRVSVITAAKRLHGRFGSILIVGGEKFGLALFDENGEYLNYRSNTSCAAGTGSFLDQQAARLNLSGIREFSERAYRNEGPVPKIASRCAVFAKTDLIHAQQEGYSLDEICDGLSYGLVKNIADTLFSNVKPSGPMIFCGGVSLNRAVVKHFAKVLEVEIVTGGHSHLYGAIGAALSLLDEGGVAEPLGVRAPADIILTPERKKEYHYEPLALRLSKYPDFAGSERYEFTPRHTDLPVPVEVDVYEPLPAGIFSAYLGIDIGSTSTKAAVLDGEGRVVAGLYTRTSGRPVAAVQALFECLDDLAAARGTTLEVLGAGTTGSGRTFIAGIVGADLALDEITAHARAASELDPDVDTVIEIGGQDSKFTTLRNGMVTFSIMNQVCAAGTGSFIEEQAKKLGCPLSEYQDRAGGARAPLSSDRCTVFMERDLNFYLSEGYSVNEVLASVLHSVRDNYLTKVAIEKNIGKRIFFQGATAKNRALVAAFEQRLGRPIMVSRYCHLTGAMGVALHLRDTGRRESSFRGTGLWREAIPVHTEVCELCANHCKITVAEVRGQSVAFGFLCGRDYRTDRYVKRETGFDLVRERNRVLYGGEKGGHAPARELSLTVGIPAALHLFDEMPLWRKFFEDLGVRTITSEGYRDGIAEGKNLTGAEFCAPMAALHGHVNYLSDRADFVFLPCYMENRHPDRDVTRNYCYYTQYSPQVVLSAVEIRNKEKILTPLVRSKLGTMYLKVQLHRMMKTLRGEGVGFMQVSNAYDRALEHLDQARGRLRDLFVREMAGAGDISVVFLGRPYTVLSRSMNKSIPDIFARHGIKAFYQDMLPETGSDPDMEGLLAAVHWKYAAQILESARAITGMEGVYPVFVTSFKCTPDSYVVEYFKRILDEAGKPYLILQLDEHDSSVGYETRIEAGIRSFRNHHHSHDRSSVPGGQSIVNGQAPVVGGQSIESGYTASREVLYGKTLLMPNWDRISCRFVEAALRKDGIDARVVTETPESIKRSMRMNTGQCIPLNIMVQNSIDYIENHGLDPGKTVLWSLKSSIACNIGMFPAYTRNLLDSYGRGCEKISVYTGDVTFMDMGARTAVSCYIGYLFGGMIRKLGCYLRPYENVPGSTDRAIERSVDILYDAFAGGRSREEALEEVMELFGAVGTTRTERPKVAIFGDLYARDNDIMNQDLIRTIEANGGEVITTPYSELMDIVASRYIRKWFLQGLYGDAALAKVLSKVVAVLNARYYRYFNRLLPVREPRSGDESPDLLSLFGLSVYHTGESMENILKIFHLLEQHPDISLFVQTNPSYCCPSLVTEAMADRIERITGVPIVTIEYDGTGGSKNDDVIPYLKYPRRRKGAEGMKKAM